ncbi:unannotated protein [freshwater metagenome]|uniref:Unannotated protein n=1 Tax=freshwater metagenome TaxID=449393 RepID=A0A6J7AQR4_9ZZZZ
MDLAAAGLGSAHGSVVLDHGPGVAGEVSAAAAEAGHHVEERLEAVPAGDARGDRLVGRGPPRERGRPAFGAAATQHKVVLLANLRRECETAIGPRRATSGATVPDRAVPLDDIVGTPELLVGHAHDCFCRGDLGVEQRVAVRVRVVGRGRRRVPDVRAQNQQRWTILDSHRTAYRCLEGIEILGDLAEIFDVPSVGLEPAYRVVGQRELGGAVDRDVVVVVDHDEPTQALEPGERRSLVADAFRQAAVAGDRERVVITDLGPEALAHRALGHGHANRVREPLTERTRGYLDPRRVVHLGVAGGGRTPLAERAKVIELEPVPVEVQHRIEQDRRVTCGEHEPIAIRPLRIGGVVAHDA